MKQGLTIAIDGPVASGKGTLASALAKRLDILYIYTGAMYRALALAALRADTNLQDEHAVFDLLQKSEIWLQEPKEQATYAVFLNGEDVTSLVQTSEVDLATSVVSKYPTVREKMVELQKAMAQGKSVVMEGRDITTVVLPDADLRLYVTAGIEERARRRYLQMQQRGEQKTMEEVIEELKLRDTQDTERTASPLTVGKDVVVVDTTNLTIGQTVEQVLALLEKKGLL